MQVPKDHTFGTMVQPDEYGTYVRVFVQCVHTNVCVQCAYVRTFMYIRMYVCMYFHVFVYCY